MQYPDVQPESVEPNQVPNISDKVTLRHLVDSPAITPHTTDDLRPPTMPWNRCLSTLPGGISIGDVQGAAVKDVAPDEPPINIQDAGDTPNSSKDEVAEVGETPYHVQARAILTRLQPDKYTPEELDARVAKLAGVLALADARKRQRMGQAAEFADEVNEDERT